MDVTGGAADGGDFVFAGDLTAFSDILRSQFRPQQRVVDHFGYIVARIIHNYLLVNQYRFTSL
jgi:hypothetical protein